MTMREIADILQMFNRNVREAHEYLCNATSDATAGNINAARSWWRLADTRVHRAIVLSEVINALCDSLPGDVREELGGKASKVQAALNETENVVEFHDAIRSQRNAHLFDTTVGKARIGTPKA